MTWRKNLKIWPSKSTNSTRFEAASPTFSGDKPHAAWPAGHPHLFMRHCALHSYEIQILTWELNVYKKTCKLFFGWTLQIDFHRPCQYLCIFPPLTQEPPVDQGLYRGFTITLRHTTLCRTSLEEWSARRRDLYLTTHDTQTRHTFTSSAVFEPTIPVSKWQQTHALGYNKTKLRAIIWTTRKKTVTFFV